MESDDEEDCREGSQEQLLVNTDPLYNQKHLILQGNILTMNPM